MLAMIAETGEGLEVFTKPWFQTEYLAVSTKRLSKSFSNDFLFLSYFTDIGGNVINITIVITSETCIDGKYKPSFLLEKLKEPVS